MSFSLKKHYANSHKSEQKVINAKCGVPSRFVDDRINTVEYCVDICIGILILFSCTTFITNGSDTIIASTPHFSNSRK